MDFKSTYILESATYPGVHITLKRIGPRRRAEIELSLAQARARVRELSMRHESVRQKLLAAIDKRPKDAEGKPVEAEIGADQIGMALELEALAAEAAEVKQAEIDPVWIRAAVKSFGGPEALTYEGQAATCELLIEHGPDELFGEVVSAIERNAYLGAERTDSLSSQSTSGAVVDSGTANGTAPNASVTAGSFSGAAAPAILQM